MGRSVLSLFTLIVATGVLSPGAQAQDPARPVIRSNHADGADMVYIPPGSFLMGDGDQNDNPPHVATLSGFWIYRNLVTVGEYRKFCDETKHAMPAAPHFDPAWSQLNHPIVNVTWDDAKAYATWAEMDLPTEAQWEKAARGRDGRVYPWGNDFDLRKVWCSRGSLGDSGGTASVGVYGVSPYGCTDMAGNVFEWCKDFYDGGYWRRRASEQVDPENVTSSYEGYRVLRGGAWIYTEPRMFRTSTRFWFPPTGTVNYYGFRCAKRITTDLPLVVTPAPPGPPASVPLHSSPPPATGGAQSGSGKAAAPAVGSGTLTQPQHTLGGGSQTSAPGRSVTPVTHTRTTATSPSVAGVSSKLAAPAQSGIAGQPSLTRSTPIITTPLPGLKPYPATTPGTTGSKRSRRKHHKKSALSTPPSSTANMKKPGALSS